LRFGVVVEVVVDVIVQRMPVMEAEVEVEHIMFQLSRLAVGKLILFRKGQEEQEVLMLMVRMEQYPQFQAREDQLQQIPVRVEPGGVVLQEQVVKVALTMEVTVAEPRVMEQAEAEVQVMRLLQVQVMVVMVVILSRAHQVLVLSLVVPVAHIEIVMEMEMPELLQVVVAVVVTKFHRMGTKQEELALQDR
jgi:hypothetical protein